MDEIQRIVFQVEGQRELERLNGELAKERDFLDQLLQIKKQGVVPVNPADITLAATKVRDYSKELENLNRQLKGGSFNTQGLQQLGYALQDFTSVSGGMAQKFNAVTNNLQMVVASMGIGGGWFLAITGLIQGIQALVTNWDKIDAWLHDLPDPATLKAKADALKKRADEVAKLEAEPTKAAAAAAGQVHGGIVAEDAARVRQLLIQRLTPEANGPSPKEIRQWVEEELPKSRSHEEFVAAMDARVNARKSQGAVQEAERLLSEATKPGKQGEGARKRLLELAKKTPGLEGLVDRLQGTPGDPTVGPTRAQFEAEQVKKYESSRDVVGPTRKTLEDYEKSLPGVKTGNAGESGIPGVFLPGQQGGGGFVAPPTPPMKPTAEMLQRRNQKFLPPPGIMREAGDPAADAAEIALREQFNAVNEAQASADMMLGARSDLVRQIEANTQRIQQLYRRNAQLMGGGGFSSMPSQWGG